MGALTPAGAVEAAPCELAAEAPPIEVSSGPRKILKAAQNVDTKRHRYGRQAELSRDQELIYPAIQKFWDDALKGGS